MHQAPFLNIFIDDSEDYRLFRNLWTLARVTERWPSCSFFFPSFLGMLLRNMTCTLWSRPKNSNTITFPILSIVVNWLTDLITCNNTEHSASKKIWRRIDLVRFNTTCWQPRVYMVVHTPLSSLGFASDEVSQQDQGTAFWLR